MRAGALGYVLKNEPTSAIRAAITEVAAGRDWVSPSLAYIFATDDAPGRPALSEQQRRALQLYATGIPLKSVARKMAISDETVKQHLQRVRLKYANAGRAAPTKPELYHRAVEDGHIPSGLLSSRSHLDCYHRAVEDGRITTSSQVAIPPLCGQGSPDVPVLGFSPPE